MRMRSIRLVSKPFQLGLLLLFVLVSAASVFAEWYKDYEEGVSQINKGNWTAAIPRLRAAIAENEEEGLNIKFYGMKFGDYFPHFYLGMAYFYTGDYPAAL